MNVVLKILSVVLGTALVLYVWYNYSDAIVGLMNLNLKIITWTCSLLPAPYGAMAESALRLALGADKAMLFAEGAWLIGGVLRFVKTAFTR